MARRKFEEDVVEETTTTETTETVEETSPDLHDQFVQILVDMGLSAEQAEAVHSTAMDLINAGDGETETTETVTEESKVEARRARRGMGSKRKRYSRRGFNADRPTRAERSRHMGEERGPRRGGRTELAAERRMRRLARQNRQLREQLQELGASPAARPISNRPAMQAQPAVKAKGLAKSTAQALEMINNYGK